MAKEKKGLIEQIINIILNILIGIFGLILLITFYSNIQTKIFKNTHSSFFGYSIFEIQTGSMADTINEGDWIIVKYARAINLKDIITYEQDGNFITHRVVEVYKETLVTKGDFNNTKDEPISRKQVVGKVVKILPSFGIFRKTLFNPFVLLTLIITLYLTAGVCKNKKDKKEENTKGKETVMNKLINKLKSIFNKTSKEEINKNEENLNIESVKNEILKAIEEKYEKENKTTEIQVVDEIKEETEIVEIENKIETEEVSEDETEMLEDESKAAAEEEEEETEVVDDNQEDQEEKDETKEEDLDKTMFFRMVSVDEDELSDTFFKQSELINSPSNISSLVTDDIKVRRTKKNEDNQEDLEDDSKESDIEKGLELIQKRKKKFKNILEKVMYIKTNEISELVEILNQREKPKSNEASIKKTFLDAYIDGKYYNYCGNVNAEYNNKNINTKMSATIAETAKTLINSYKNADMKYQEKVSKYEKIFTLILYLEQAYAVREDIDEKRQNYETKINKCLGTNAYTDGILGSIINDAIKLQRTHNGMIKYSFEKLDTNIFELDIEKVLSKTKKIYLADLKHNIAFSKIYSDYIVDKTYKEGVVAEDKIHVLLTLLLRQITMDMLDANFNKKYVLQIPGTLCEKEKKFTNVAKVFADEYAKNNIVMLIDYDSLSKNSKLIRTYIKNGYHFAVNLENVLKIKVKDRGLIELMDYIIMGRRSRDKKSIIASLSEEVNNKLIYVEISSKVENGRGN